MVLHQMRDAVSDHPRLAAACCGEQQQWSFNVRNGLFLLRIEAFKKIHEEGLQECGVGPGDPLLKTAWMGGTEDGIQSLRRVGVPPDAGTQTRR